MNTNPFWSESYPELREKALACDAQQIDIDTLGAWFENYGWRYWNGECFDLDGYELYPIYKLYEDGEEIVIGYEVR